MARLNARMSLGGITQGTIAVYATTDARHPHKILLLAEVLKC
jgi:uncharacterized protein YwbE